LTYRTVASYGLIAGVGWADQRSLSPGLLCDLYIYRQRYDDAQHGVQRKKKTNPATAGIR
jgi:hypothetical protein